MGKPPYIRFQRLKVTSDIPCLWQVSLILPTVSACTYPVMEGLRVRTDSPWVIQRRKMIVELLLSSDPGNNVLQGLAVRFGVRELRLKPRRFAEPCGKREYAEWLHRMSPHFLPK